MRNRSLAAATIMIGVLGLTAAHALPIGSTLAARSINAARLAPPQLFPVAMQANAEQLSGEEVEEAAPGIWKGGWTNDISGGAGHVLFRVDRAGGGTVSGTGEATGGRCDRTFRFSGWYRDSLVQLDLHLPAAGEGCPKATVSISMRMGRRNGDLVGIGHWSNTVDGRAAGRAFGFLELVRQ